MSIGRIVRNMVLASIALGILVVVWAVGIEPGRLVVRDYAIGLARWPKALDGYRIAFVTDIHAGSPHITLNYVREIVAETNALNPDVILLGGDYAIDSIVGGTKIDASEIAAVLKGLKARDGVFAVLGNHDNWDNGPRIARLLEDAGIPVLEDRAVEVATPRGKYWLVGVSDFETAPHDVAKALAGVSGATIVLTHSPDVFPALPDFVALTLAGHTHGGQVYVPFLGRPVVPSRYGQRYVMGVIREGGRTLFVGSGIGTSILPVRFLTPPEVSVLTLRSE